MKKISTAAALKMEKVEGEKLTIGLDLGDRSSWYCVLNEAGAILRQQRAGAFSSSIRRSQNSSPKQKPERLQTTPATRIVLPVVRNSTSISSPGCRLTPA